MTLIIKQMRKLVRFLEQVLVCIKNQYLQHLEIKQMQMEKEMQRGKEIRRRTQPHLQPVRKHHLLLQLLQSLQTSDDQVEINRKKGRN